jgi:hypothetical protein
MARKRKFFLCYDRAPPGYTGYQRLLDTHGFWNYLQVDKPSDGEWIWDTTREFWRSVELPRMKGAEANELYQQLRQDVKYGVPYMMFKQFFTKLRRETTPHYLTEKYTLNDHFTYNELPVDEN